MKIEVGMYVRYDDIGTMKIAKIVDMFIDEIEYDTLNCFLDNDSTTRELDIIKHSSNITDLIEVGDAIKHPVLGIRGITNINIDRKKIGLDGLIWCIEFENFKKAFEAGTMQILTKEQFEANSYKIGE